MAPPAWPLPKGSIPASRGGNIAARPSNARRKLLMILGQRILQLVGLVLVSLVVAGGCASKSSFTRPFARTAAKSYPTNQVQSSESQASTTGSRPSAASAGNSSQSGNSYSPANTASPTIVGYPANGSQGAGPYSSTDLANSTAAAFPTSQNSESNSGASTDNSALNSFLGTSRNSNNSYLDTGFPRSKAGCEAGCTSCSR